MSITAALVKELRERTGVGMMDCKKALVETNGDMEAAIELMRKSGQAKAAKKAGRIAAEGVIIIKANDTGAMMLEMNCETDFVARDESFLALASNVCQLALDHSTTDVAALSALTLDGKTVEEARLALVAKIGENMTVRRLESIAGAQLAQYLHGAKIGVVVASEGGSEETGKHIAMHVAANNPEFLSPDDVSAEVVEKEKQIQIDIAVQSGKPAEIAEKMVVGRMKKFVNEVSLLGQAFVMDPSITVAEYLKQAGATVTGFKRLEVGEGIEKKEEDFAAEVEATMAAAKQ